jgi:lysyl-tRNA synthetase class 2
VSPVRAPIATLDRLAPPAAVSVAGRLTHVEAGAALLVDGTGTLELSIAGERPPLGAWVEATGTWDGRVLAGARVAVRTAPARPFPVPGGEWMRLHGDGGRVLDNLRRRAEVLRAVRRWFDARGFLEVETPAAVPSPGLDLHLSAAGATGLARAPRWLITSPEYQMKRLLAGGMGRIYQLGRCFRRGERGPLHEPEFTMLEWYRAFAGSDAIMRDTEALVAAVARAVHGGATTLPGRGRPVDVRPPWQRLTVAEAFERFAGVALDAVLPDEERFFRLLVERVEPELGHPKPVFLTHWPASMASLARLHPDDPRWADRVEAYVDGLELCNGFGELVDPVEQRARLERDRDARAAGGLDAYPIDERFLAALEEGLPPSGGNALGIDRLVMLVTGARHIEEVVAVPQSRL